MDYRKEILRLKKEKNAIILAHNYQAAEIQGIADFVGDSLGLAKRARSAENRLIVLCGVDFMAETAKLLNPEKKVIIPARDAICPMAAQLEKGRLADAKKKHPEARVVLYVNSSAEAKALADCCCTSANAAEVVNAMDSETVIFGPDRNLGLYVQKRTGKKIVHVPENGCCYVHRKFSLQQILDAKRLHPDAKVLAHPECSIDVQDAADAVLSTGGMLEYAKKSSAGEFIIATETGMLHALERQNPGKKFYPACSEAVCVQQKKITLEKLYLALRDERFEVAVPAGISEKALGAIECMFGI